MIIKRYGGRDVDLPSEFLSRPYFYHHLNIPSDLFSEIYTELELFNGTRGVVLQSRYM